jgi:hypothetical protein
MTRKKSGIDHEERASALARLGPLPGDSITFAARQRK